MSRLDNWLKLVCLFKHRSDATEACGSGHVRLNGARAKAASKIREGDLVEIVGERYRRVVILAIPERSVSKDVARTLYQDETPVIEQPPRVAQVRERGMGRPTKKDRRELEHFWKGK